MEGLPKEIRLVTDKLKSRQIDDEFIHNLRLAARQEFFDTFMGKLLDFTGNLQTLAGLNAFGEEMQRFYKFQDDNAIGFIDEVRKHLGGRQPGKYQVAVDVPEPIDGLCDIKCPLFLSLRANFCKLHLHKPVSEMGRMCSPGPGCPRYEG